MKRLQAFEVVKALCWSAFIMGLAISPRAAAQTTWQNPGASSWFTGTNWSNGVPDTAQTNTQANVGEGTAQVSTGGTASAGTLTVSGAGTVQVSNASTLEAGGLTLNDTGALQVTGGSLLTVTGASGTGNITLDDGTLQSSVATGSANAVAASIAIGTGGGTIDSNGAHALTLSGAITGETADGGMLTLTTSVGDPSGSNRPNDFFLSGTNTNTGGLAVTGRTYVTADADNVLGSGALSLGSGSDIGIGGSFSESVTALTGAGSISANGYGSPSGSGAATLSVQSGTYSGTLHDGFSGSNSGVLSLTKTSTGALVLSGTSTYSGATEIVAGTLQAGSTTALSAASTYTVDDQGTLDLADNSQTVGALAGNGAVTLGSATTTTLTVGRTGVNTTFSGVISGAGGLTLDPSAGYTLPLTNAQQNVNFTLTGQNTYTGPTTIDVGFLGLQNGGTVAGDIVINVSQDGSEGGTLAIGNDTAGAAYTLANSVSGQGGIFISQTVVTATGNNSGYSGRVQIDANADMADSGEFIVGSATAAGNGSAFFVIGRNADFDLNGHDVQVSEIGDETNFGATPGAAGTVLLNGGELTLGTTNGVGDLDYFAGSIADGATAGGVLHKIGDNTLELLGNNNYSGGTLLDGGTISIASSTALGTGRLTMADSTTLAFLSGGAGTFLSVNNAVTLNGAATIVADGTNVGDFNGVVSGKGSLVKTGSSSLLITADDTYTGGTTISAGILQIGGGGTAGSIVGPVVDNGGLIFARTIATTFDGVISGTGYVAPADFAPTTLTLTNANTYSGGTYGNGTTTVRVTNSTIANGAVVSSSIGTGPFRFFGGTLQAYVPAGDGITLGNAVTVASNGGTIDSNGAKSLELLGPISEQTPGGGTLTLTNSAGMPTRGGNFDIILSGENTNTGGTVVAGNTIVQLNAANALGTGGLAMGDGANLFLGHYDQAVTTLSGGGVIAATGYLASSSPSVATLTVQSGAFAGILQDGQSYSNGQNFNGKLALTKTSPGVLVLSGTTGSNPLAYSGPTQVAAGTLQAGSTTGFSPNSAVTVAGGAVLDLGGFSNAIASLAGAGAVTNSGTAAATLTAGGDNSSTTFSGTLGDGAAPLALAKAGTGVLTLTGPNTYSGGTDLEAGTLAIGDSTSLGSGPLAMARGTTLAFVADGLTLANAIQFTQSGDPTIDTGPNDETISGPISGPGDLDKIGAGTLTLTGTDTYTGATVVQQGTLLVNGSTANSIATVDDGATLGGFGTVGGFDVLAGGRLAPGFRVPYSTLRVAGNGTFENGSTFAVQINAAGQTDAVALAGTATLNGGTVTVAAASGGTYNAATRYTILSAAGGRTGQFGTVTTNANFAFLAPRLSYDANDVFLGFAQTAAFPSAAATQNQRAVAGAVQSLGPGNPLYQAILTQSPAGAQQAFKSLSGEAHASAPAAAVVSSRTASGAVLDRFWNIPVDGGGDAASVLDQFGSTTSPALLRCYIPEQATGSGGSVPAAYTVWGQAVGDFFRNGGDGNASSVDNTLGGVAFGIDTKVDAKLFNNWRIGVAGGYTNDSFAVGDGGGQGTFESVFGTLYGGARYGAVDIRLGASYGGNETTSHRTVAFPGFAEAERSAYGGDTVQGFGELGYRLGFPHAVFEPIVDAGVTHVHQDGYREKGGVAALLGFAEDTDVEFTTLGFRSEVTPFANVPLIGRLMLGWEHSYGDIDPAATAAFASGSAAFQSYGTPIDRDAAVAETDVVWRATPATSVTLAYTGQIGRRDRENGVRGRIDYRF